MINSERLIQLLMELCATDSQSRNERQMADKLTGILQELGFEVHEDDAGTRMGGNTGNLYGRLAGTVPGEPLLFTAHMDRVVPGLGVKPRLENGCIVSDGSTVLGADDAAGLAAILEAVRTVREQRLPHPTIEVSFTICEEVGLLGSKNANYGWFTSKLGFALDSGGRVGEITIRAPFQQKLYATFHGRAAHAGLEPQKGISAIQMAALAVSRMPLLRIDQETTANIGTFAAEGPTNIVPASCRMVAEARSLDGAKVLVQVARMREAMESAATELGGRLELRTEQSYAGIRLELDSPPVRRAARAAERTGLEAAYESSGGGSDGNIFNGAGIPMAVLGVGYEAIHSTAERISVAELERLARWTLAIIEGE